MARTSRCPNCGCTAFLPGRAAGMKVTCRSCGQRNRVAVGADGVPDLVAAGARGPSVPASLRHNVWAHRRVRTAMWALLLLFTLELAMVYALSTYGWKGLEVGALGVWDDLSQVLGYAVAVALLGLFVWAKLGSNRGRIAAFSIGSLLQSLGVAGRFLIWLELPRDESISLWIVGGLCGFHAALALVLVAGLLGAIRLRRDEVAVSREQADGR